MWGAWWAEFSPMPQNRQDEYKQKSNCAESYPGVVTIAVFLPQTKDVTKAMDEKRFDEAMKLRGR